MTLHLLTKYHLIYTEDIKIAANINLKKKKLLGNYVENTAVHTIDYSTSVKKKLA